MRTTTKECSHCGITYSYYMSGSHIPNHNSDIYCPGCEKVRAGAVAKALGEIPVLFKYKYIPTDDYSLEDLLEIEKVKREHDEFEWQKKRDAGEVLFPIARRVYSTLTDSKTGETSRSGGVKYNGESYSYFYWPSKKEEAEIKVYKKINMTTGEPVPEFKLK
jgi:hypothetical protein